MPKLFFRRLQLQPIGVAFEEIVWRDPAIGQVHLTTNYDFYTSYLELSNSKLITATDLEKGLCYQLTTGGSDGINVGTWNALNQAYYSRSADNFFGGVRRTPGQDAPLVPYARARAVGRAMGCGPSTWSRSARGRAPRPPRLSGRAA
jgi:hypothetical protein